MNTLKLKALNTLVAASLMALAGAASAQVVGGGATLPENLYNGTGPAFKNGILTGISGFNKYIGVGSGNGKKAFFGDNSDFFTVKNAAGDIVKVYDPKVRVHYAGSDSLLTETDANGYNSPSNVTTGKAKFGPLVQIPVALTSVTVPFKGFSKLELTSEQLAKIFADPSIVKWNDADLAIPGAPNADIKVIYRADGSGTTEIFLRHLNAVNPTLVKSVNSTFSEVVNTTNTGKYVAANGTSEVISKLADHAYAIAYVSPEVVEFGNPAKVASIKNKDLSGAAAYVLPTINNVKTAVQGIAPPSGSAAAEALNWGIGHGPINGEKLAKPEKGYPIVGVTNLILSQCYSTGDANSKIRTFLANNYSASSAPSANDAAITIKKLVPLPTNWQNAVRSTFYEPTSTLAIGNTSVCAGYAGR